MDFIKKNYKAVPFPIDEFLQETGARSIDEAQILLDNMCKSVKNFDKCELSLVSFVQQLQDSRFEILKTPEAKKYFVSKQLLSGTEMLELERQQFYLASASNVTSQLTSAATSSSRPPSSAMQKEIVVSPVPPTSRPFSLSLGKRSWSQAIDSDEKIDSNASDSGTDDDVTLTIWELWMELIRDMNNDDDVHNHSLERLNIIQLGNQIGSPTTKKYYSEELIDRTTIIVKTIPDYYSNANDYHDTLFDHLLLCQDDAKEYLASQTLAVYASSCSFTKFAEQVYKTLTYEMFNANDDVYTDEVTLNVKIVFPIMHALSQTNQDWKFLPGETRVKAVSKELKLLHNDTSHYYNADGILSLRSCGLEVLLMETTGKLHVEDKPKEVKDYVKAGYGLVSMLHNIGRLYKYGSFDIYKGVSIFFLQITPFKIRLWKFNMTDKQLYCNNCIGSVKIPVDRETSEGDTRTLVNLMWLLRENIEATMHTLDRLKSSHLKNLKTVTRKRQGYQELLTLDTFFKQNANVILQDKVVKDSESLYMNSF